MIEAKQLIKQFGKLRALDGLSIQVPEGSIYGLSLIHISEPTRH